MLSAFVRGQFYVMLALGAVYSIGLGLTGLDLALLIGMLCIFYYFHAGFGVTLEPFDVSVLGSA